MAVNGHISSSKPYGYKTFGDLQDLQAGLEALYRNEIIPAVKCGLCDCIITQFSDVEDEINGMITYGRKVIKVSADDMKKLADRL